MQITPASAPLKLPVDSAKELLSDPYFVQIYPDGSLHTHTPVASLGAMKTHVTSQFIQGGSVCGYVRVTLDSTGMLAGMALARLIVPISPIWYANILLNSILTANPMYYDDIPISARTPCTLLAQAPFSDQSQVFDIVVNGNTSGPESYAFLYHVLVT